MVALNDENTRPTIERALETRADTDIEAALGALQTEAVRQSCMEAMQDAGEGLDKLVALWGRREKMQSA